MDPNAPVQPPVLSLGEDTDLNGLILSRASMHGVDLGFVDLKRARLRGVDFLRAVLSGADLSEASLSGVNLCDADLRVARLIDVKVSGSVFVGADLSGAHLHGADLRGVELTQTRFRNENWLSAEFDGRTKWPDGFDPAAAGAVDEESKAALDAWLQDMLASKRFTRWLGPGQPTGTEDRDGG